MRQGLEDVAKATAWLENNRRTFAGMLDGVTIGFCTACAWPLNLQAVHGPLAECLHGQGAHPPLAWTAPYAEVAYELQSTDVNAPPAAESPKIDIKQEFPTGFDPDRFAARMTESLKQMAAERAAKVAQGGDRKAVAEFQRRMAKDAEPEPLLRRPEDAATDAILERVANSGTEHARDVLRLAKAARIVAGLKRS